MKTKSMKFFETITMHMELKGRQQMILENPGFRSFAKLTSLENFYGYGRSKMRTASDIISM